MYVIWDLVKKIVPLILQLIVTQVCMFVIAISCVCFFITVISVYKIIILVYSSCKWECPRWWWSWKWFINIILVYCIKDRSIINSEILTLGMELIYCCAQVIVWKLGKHWCFNKGHYETFLKYFSGVEPPPLWSSENTFMHSAEQE